MHSCDSPPPPPTTGPGLLLELGRLIIRSRSRSPAPRLLHAKAPARPSTSVQVLTQPKAESEELKPGVEAQLSNHVQALWNDQIPICIEVVLAPDCEECRSRITSDGEAFDKQHNQPRGLLLERWTMQALPNKPQDASTFITSQWLLNAVRSQLHFSQLSAWLATLKRQQENPPERRRKLSRESCNYQKLPGARSLGVVYSVKTPGEAYQLGDFRRPPAPHCFPAARLADNLYLKVVLESLPRIDEIPTVKCTCRTDPVAPEELTGKLNDLTIGPRCSKYPSDSINSNIGTSSRRLSIVSNSGSTGLFPSTEKTEKTEPGMLLDDRMHTPCSENGKHKCNCDEESDGNHRSSNSLSETKVLDERRLKEIAKYKRRLRKESKLKKLCDSTSSEGDGHQKITTHTSIPILQAARFDRLRAIGCYRNQTYLTRAPEPSRRHAATQTDAPPCRCAHDQRLVRSDANYDLASLDPETEHNTGRRKRDDDGNAVKKLKCDNPRYKTTCDNILVDNSSINEDEVVKRPKLRRFFPIVDRLDKIVTERAERDMQELHLKTDDTVFSKPKETKRQKTYSISEDDYVLYEKCDYGTIDRCEVESPRDSEDGFKFPDPRRGQEALVPSPTEMDRFRWRFDSAASMVFHTKTGLPLTSSPAPLRRGNNCFDFDDSINGISGIKSALFHPISPPPPAPASPASPASPAPEPPQPRPSRCDTLPAGTKKEDTPKLRIGPSTGLLGSFEESALKGRLEPVATVHGFAAELGASGAFCPPHRRLPVTVFFYAPGGTNAPYMGHINLGPSGYRVARSGTIQVSLFNPHGTLVKMFVVLYDLTCMPPMARTFLRQRTLYMPAGAPPPPRHLHKWLRYLIHLRFMTSKSGKLYLHTDIRIIVSRKADLDTATAHSLFRPIAKSEECEERSDEKRGDDDRSVEKRSENRSPNRVFGGSSEFDSELKGVREFGHENQNGVSYELRSFTYAPENPKYSPR